MYFDVDSEIELDLMDSREFLDAIAVAVADAHARIVTKTSDALLFTAAPWRAYGLLALCVRQLPLGLSVGLVECHPLESKRTVRFRMSLAYLRISLLIPVALLLFGLVRGHSVASPVLWCLLFVLGICGPAIYWAAIRETRRYFRVLLERCAKPRPGDHLTQEI